MKLALIGGGGVRTPMFTQSIAKYAERLGIQELCIMDNDAQKLRVYGGLAKHIARTERAGLAVELTDDINRAAEGADYVVTTLRVGGDEGRVLDERVALSCGLLGQETTGAGGFSFALRTIPVLLSYCETFRRLGNNPIIFNFTNPSGLVTQALHDHGYKDVIGICDSPTQLKTEAAGALGAGIHDVETEIYGLNHLSWLGSMKIQGIETMDALLASDAFLEGSRELRSFDKGLLRLLGSIPVEYLYYYYYRDRAVRSILSSTKTRGESVRDINRAMTGGLAGIDVEKEPERAFSVFQRYTDARNNSYMSIEASSTPDHGNFRVEVPGIDPSKLALPEDTEGYEGYSGVVFNYIEALRGKRPLEIPINVENNGAIAGMADDDIVEISCVVDQKGAHPRRITCARRDNLLLMQQVKLYEKLTVAASDAKSIDLGVRALMQHPLIGSYGKAVELMKKYGAAFPAFFSDWR